MASGQQKQPNDDARNTAIINEERNEHPPPPLTLKHEPKGSKQKAPSDEWES